MFSFPHCRRILFLNSLFQQQEIHGSIKWFNIQIILNRADCIFLYYIFRVQLRTWCFNRGTSRFADQRLTNGMTVINNYSNPTEFCNSITIRKWNWIYQKIWLACREWLKKDVYQNINQLPAQKNTKKAFTNWWCLRTTLKVPSII